MIVNNDKISRHQLCTLLIINLFGTTSLTLPRYGAEAAGTDGWIAILGAVALACLYVFVITRLTKRFPDSTFVEFAEKIITKPAAIAVSLVLCALLIVFSALELRMFGEIVKQTLLNRTPLGVITLSMLLAVVYSARKGYECRARMAEIYIFLIFIPIIILILFAIPQVDIHNLGPIFTAPPKQLLTGSVQISMKFAVLILLLMGGSFLAKDQRRHVGRSVILAVVLVGIVDILLFLRTMGSFGETGTLESLWPVMNLMQIIDIPILEIERQDALMMVFWILTEFTLINEYVFFAGIILQKVFRRHSHRKFLLPLVPVIFIISFLPPGVMETFAWMDAVYFWTGILFLLPIPLLLLLISKGRRIKEDGYDESY